MALIRKLGLLLMAAGALLVVWSGYQWWAESRTAVYDSKTALAYTPRTHPNDPALSRGIPPYPAPPTGATLGQLVIPRIGAILPIVEGTDEDQLAKGVGHLRGSALPGVTGNAILSGHRDTVFRRMGEVKKGDLLVVRTEAGTFTYRVQKMWVTKPTDRSVLAPRPTPILTLTTCYPFGYIGSAPDRYIVEAVLIRIDSKKKIKREPIFPLVKPGPLGPLFCEIARDGILSLSFLPESGILTKCIPGLLHLPLQGSRSWPLRQKEVARDFIFALSGFRSPGVHLHPQRFIRTLPGRESRKQVQNARTYGLIDF